MKKKKFPTFYQWKQLFKVLTKKEKIVFLTFLLICLFSGGYLIVKFYIYHTTLAPAPGGILREGLIGQPRFINPIYGETNDIDRDLIELIYSGLLKYTPEGKITTDLAENYYVSEDGKNYTFELKDNLFWQDGLPLTVDDIIFTIKTIQNSEYKSPLRAKWLNVEIKKISERIITFSLPSPYNSFLETATLKILPAHIWKNISPQNFFLSPYNLQPIGSGPYLISKIEQDKKGFIQKITLSANPRYHGKIPYIKTIYFYFFENEKNLVKAIKKRKVDSFLNGIQLESHPDSFAQNFNVYSLKIPRYFAIFFNPDKAKIFSEKNLTKALIYGVEKSKILEELSKQLSTKISAVDSPILPEYFDYQKPTLKYSFDQEKAISLLDKLGYNLNKEGKRVKTVEKKPSFQFKSYLKVGSKGNEVKELEGCLIRLDEEFHKILGDTAKETYDKKTEEAVFAFQKKYLPDLNPTGETGPSTRKKLNELCFPQQNNLIYLKFSLTLPNQWYLVKTAQVLKSYWEKIGIENEIKVLDSLEIKESIKRRDYEALLYGQALGILPDLYPFWHSSQINDPGLNLSNYQNKTVDQLLKEARESLEENIKKEKYEKIQEIILEEAPVFFLYDIDISYYLSPKIKGFPPQKIVDPSKRFINIENWYIKTQRVWKR